MDFIQGCTVLRSCRWVRPDLVPNHNFPLAIFHKQLGDVLLLEPALSKLVQTCEGPVMLATRPEFAPLLSLMDDVLPMPKRLFRRASQVISFDPRLRASIQALTTIALKKQLVVMAAKQVRAWHRIVYSSGCCVVDESPWYRAEYFFRQIPGDTVFRPPKLRYPPDDWRPLGLPDSFVLIHATSAWKNKCWPASAWGKAISRLDEQGVGPFVITGGNAAWERDFVDEILCSTSVPIVNLCGSTSLSGYLATVAAARLVLCIDGSAAHLAAAFRRPSVVMFGPTHPIHWYYPAPYVRMLDARIFAEEKRPAASAIPVEVLVDNALALYWGAA